MVNMNRKVFNFIVVSILAVSLTGTGYLFICSVNFAGNSSKGTNSTYKVSFCEEMKYDYAQGMPWPDDLLDKPLDETNPEPIIAPLPELPLKLPAEVVVASRSNSSAPQVVPPSAPAPAPSTPAVPPALPSIPVAPPSNTTGLTLVAGKAVATSTQLEKLMHKRNPGALNLSSIYIQMQDRYGIRADVAFCQMVLETNALKYGGDVSITQHNTAGIGAVGGGAGGASFNTWDEGVEAQFQHLFAYANKNPLPAPQVDPRFYLVSQRLRGTAVYVEWMGYGNYPNDPSLLIWASDPQYGAKISRLLNEALSY